MSDVRPMHQGEREEWVKWCRGAVGEGHEHEAYAMQQLFQEVADLRAKLAEAQRKYVDQRMDCDSHAGPLLERAEAAEAKLTEAERKLDEARTMLESIPQWGSYKWNEVAGTVAMKLRENAGEIVALAQRAEAAEAKLEAAVAQGHASALQVLELEQALSALRGKEASRG